VRRTRGVAFLITWRHLVRKKWGSRLFHHCPNLGAPQIRGRLLAKSTLPRCAEDGRTRRLTGSVQPGGPRPARRPPAGHR
jgi:hypothetical protein